jgi:RNA polymerase sigma factor (sigma-70 family)
MSPFDQSFELVERSASVHAARAARRYGLPRDAQRDLRQEALLDLWCKSRHFDSRRGNWRTFAEAVIANRIRSVMRHDRAARRRCQSDELLEDRKDYIADPTRIIELRVDVQRVLTGVSASDRAVATALMHNSVTDTANHLRLGRSTIYQAISRLRADFVRAGLVPLRSQEISTHGRTHHAPIAYIVCETVGSPNSAQRTPERHNVCRKAGRI